MTLWSLCQAALMVINGLAIINNDRFLEKYGWGYSQLARGGGMPPPTADFGGGAPPAGVLARQAIEFLHAVTYLRVPLIPINAAVVLVKLVFG